MNDAWRRLDANPRAANLEEMALDDDALVQLAAHPSVMEIRDVQLDRNRVTANGLSSFLAASVRGGSSPLTVLSARENDLGGGLSALASLDVGEARLKELALSFNQLTDADLTALAASPLLAGVRTLWLEANAITDEGARALAASGLRPRFLSLAWNPIGDDGVEALVASPVLSEVTFLDLRHCPFGERGAAALAASPHLRRQQVKRTTRKTRVGPGMTALCPYCRSEIVEERPRCVGCWQDTTRDARYEEPTRTLARIARVACVDCGEMRVDNRHAVCPRCTRDRLKATLPDWLIERIEARELA